jgi:prephenate dehydrogenase
VPPGSPSFERIAIVGLGLIGGSWALALKRRRIRAERVGCDRPSVLKRALAAGAIDRGSPNLATAVQNADLVILATPVGAILQELRLLKTCVSPRALVTDVGSTKRQICERARETLGAEPLFLGGHPLAGKESCGFKHADAALFKGAYYVLSPLAPADLRDRRVTAFKSLIRQIGARPYVADAAAHDHAIAFLSHLPQLVSTALASLIGERAGPSGIPLELSASGFRDMTRLAGSPYAIWRDICRSNSDNIGEALELLISKFEAMKRHLGNRKLERDFHRAQNLRGRRRE